MGINRILSVEKIFQQYDKPMKKNSLIKPSFFIIILFIVLALSGCDGEASASTGQNEILENVNNSPPSDDENDDLEATFTPTPETPLSDSSGNSEGTIPSKTPTPTSTKLPESWQLYPVIPEVSPRAIEIYQRGIAMGNDPHHFSKIGDCQNISTYFLAPLEDPDLHSLGEEYANLQEVIDWFFGSYSRESLAVAGGLNVAAVLSPFHADVEKCKPNEHPLACEVRIHNPSIAIVSLEENWGSRTAKNYEEHLRTIIEYLISEGILPILATKADNIEGDYSINKTITKVAEEYELPIWNFWLAVQPLPNHGLKNDGFHLTLAGPYFDSEWHMESGWTIRNLTALQTLDVVWRAVTQPGD